MDDLKNQWQFWSIENDKLMNQYYSRIEEYEKGEELKIDTCHRNWTKVKRWILPPRNQTGLIEGVGAGFLTLRQLRTVDNDGNVTLHQKDVVLEPRITCYDEEHLQEWTLMDVFDSPLFQIRNASGYYLSCGTGGNMTVEG